MFQSWAGTKRKPAAHFFTLSRRMAFAIATLLCLLWCHSPAFAQKTQTKNAVSGVNKKPKASSPPNSANVLKAKVTKGGRRKRTTAKFDPIPAMPITGRMPIFVASGKRIKEAGAEIRSSGLRSDHFFAECYFETDDNLGSEVIVKYNVRNTDDDSDETKDKLRQPTTGAKDVTAKKVRNPCILNYRYFVRIELLPVSGATESWDQQKVRVHIRVPKVVIDPPQGGTTYVQVKTVP